MSEPIAKVTEVFRSIQGEGPYAGVPQVFVRFFECHMHCVWCDTPEAIGDTVREYEEKTQEDLLGLVKPLAAGVHSISLTGGEPLLQADFLRGFIPCLRQQGWRVYLETSGVLHQALAGLIDGIDMISMDLKLPSSTQQRAFWKEHEQFLKVALSTDVYVKAVITSQTTDEDVSMAVDLIKTVNPQVRLFLQPNSFEFDEALFATCVRHQSYALKFLNDVRVMPQMHHFIGIR